MFVGHYAPALAAAALSRRVPLWVLLIAAQAADIALFLLSLAGVEHLAILPGITRVSPFDVYDAPWSHSLLGSFGIAALLALAVRLAGLGARAAWIAAAVAVTHWPIDWLVDAPTLSIAGGAARHGLALYDRPLVALPLELAMTAAALVAYANATRALDWRGRAALAILAGGLAAMQFGFWLYPPAVAADPAPASVARSALALYVITGVFAWWCDRTRERS